jgi:hypothetical protein
LLAPRPAAAAAAMQAAAARARRVLTSPAASGLPGILWGSASGAEGALLLHLHGVPSSASSPHRARGFSSCFATQSPGELYYLESLNFVIPLRRSRGLPGAAFRRTGRERAQLLANIFVFSTPGRLCSLLVTLLGVFMF